MGMGNRRKTAEERQAKNLQEGKTPQAHTMERVREVASMIVKGIVLTVDIPEWHQTGKVPMLDVVVWLG